jgi:hypothetical protein
MYSHLECTTVTLWRIIFSYFFWNVFPDAEQPPTYGEGNNSTRLDIVLRYVSDPNAWAFTTAAHIESKAPNAAQDRLDECETQLQRGAATLFAIEGPGGIHSLSIADSFCRVFTFAKNAPGGPVMERHLTGEGGSGIDLGIYYLDITDEEEGRLVNSILRDMRQSMG